MEDWASQEGIKLSTEAQREAARQKIDSLNQQITAINSNPIPTPSIPGLKVHLCSLVAPDSPSGSPWMPVYIHSKIMIIDDVFLTHGSANCNRRSMEVDSELNICHERMDVTQSLRRHLLDIHTGGIADGASDSVDAAGKAWDYIIQQNASNQKNRLRPIASLIGFMWTSDSRLRLD